PASDLEILVFERGHFPSYSSCGIPYWVGDLVEGPDRLVARDQATFRDGYGIDVRLRHEVTGVDLDRREVTARALDDGTERRYGFDRLVYAAGAAPVRPQWTSTVDGVFGVQTLDDGTALRAFIADEKPATGVVVGGGYIGVEMAEALVRRGLTVTLVEQAPQPMSTVDPDMGALVADAIRGLGIEVRTGVTGTAVTKVCDLEVGRTGLGERQAAEAGFRYVTATVESTNRAGYFPGAVPMTVKLIAERRSGRLLGGQIVGRTEAAKRIDALAVAVCNAMTVEEMTALDLGYAPPYAPVWDPVLIAARKAAEAVEAERA